MPVERSSSRVVLATPGCARNVVDSRAAGAGATAERVGRTEYRDPEVDDGCLVVDPGEVGVGVMSPCRVIETDGVDLVVRPEGSPPEQDGFGERP